MTSIHYRYTNSAGFRVSHNVAFPGIPTITELAMISCSMDHSDFIPGIVGMKDLQEENPVGWVGGIDHPFHEITGIISITEEKLHDMAKFGASSIIDPRPICEIAQAFHNAFWSGDYKPNFAREPINQPTMTP